MGEESEIEENEKHLIPSEGKTFKGYFLPSNSIILAMISIFGALICFLTIFIIIPIPATEGYFNIGDIGVMIAGILFGPIVGAIAGGVGSAIADIIFAPHYAIPTLIIKGLEGFVVGLISNPRKNYKKFNYRDIIAVILGGLIIVSGYFIYQTFFYGLIYALVEVPINILQSVIAATSALIFAKTVRRKIIEGLPEAFEKIFIMDLSEIKS
ncbi:MAG: ECF transporter S component [Promethearchaeota archaeon]